eukprot:5651303-Amphidinium_carterae.1
MEHLETLDTQSHRAPVCQHRQRLLRCDACYKMHLSHCASCTSTPVSVQLLEKTLGFRGRRPLGSHIHCFFHAKVLKDDICDGLSKFPILLRIVRQTDCCILPLLKQLDYVTAVMIAGKGQNVSSSSQHRDPCDESQNGILAALLPMEVEIAKHSLALLAPLLAPAWQFGI